MSGDRRGPADEFARRLRSALEDYGPEAPAEKLWREIEARRDEDGPAAPSGEEGRAGDDGRREGSGSAPTRPWRGWGLAAAALLVLAVGLSRIGPSGPSGAAEPTVAASGPADPRPSPSTLPGPYAVATGEHFREAEALLVFFRSEPPEDTDQTRAWARTLLGTTRVLMDSPAADDTRLADALADLELVLVQIANLGGPTSTEDRRYVERSLTEGQLMTKLRTVAETTDPFTTAED